jgi:hypothetical protein
MLKPIRTMALTMALIATPALADDFSLRSAVGGGLGGALGGFLGAELGGRSAAILGSGLGAAAGTAVATDGYPKYYKGRDYRYRNCPPGKWKNGRCRYDD